MTRRLGAMVAMVLASIGFVVGAGASAGAASLTPTDWRSTLVSVAPESDPVRVEVFEGGEAIRVVVQPGHQLTVPGYANEPYLRITADGSVEVNRRSPTWWSNGSMTGSGNLPAEADASATPDWQRIGGGGAVTWHDHRIHAMPGITGDTDWTVTFAVDGLPHVARGRLTKLPSHSPAVEVLVALGVIAIVALVVGRGRARLVTSIAVLGATAIATTIAIGEAVSTPAGMDVPLLHIMTAVASLVVAILATTFPRRFRRTVTALFVAAIALGAWWWALMVPALTAAIVPNAFADPVVRVGLAVVFGLLVAAAALLVLTGGFTIDTTTDGTVDADQSAPV